MLGLPNAFAGCGYGIGTVMLLVAAWFSFIGLRLLAIAADNVHESGIYFDSTANGVTTDEDEIVLMGKESCKNYGSVDAEKNDVVEQDATKNGRDSLINYLQENQDEILGDYNPSCTVTKRNSSFYSVANATLPKVTYLIDIAVALKCFGVATGYLITVGDCMVDAFKFILKDNTTVDDILFLRLMLDRHFWVTFALLTVMPVCFFPTLDKLKYTSSISLAIVVLLAVGIILYAEGILDPCPDSHVDYLIQQDLDPMTDCSTDLNAVTNFKSTLSHVPVFVFAFTCHPNLFFVFNELHDRTKSRLDGVLVSTILISLFFYGIVSIEGYRTYGSNVYGDLLRSYPLSTLVTLFRLAVAVMVLFHYPLQVFPARLCLTTFVNSLAGQNFGSASNDNTSAAKKSSQFHCITSLFLFFSYMTAMAVDDLGKVFAVVGSTGSTIVTYILPGLIVANLNSYLPLSLKILAYLQVLVGLIIIPLALAAIF